MRLGAPTPTATAIPRRRTNNMTITSLPDTASMTIEDVQGRADTRRIPINRVGIKDIRHPVRVSERSGGQQHTIATASMYVNLPEDVKGTHMSRFVQLLNEHDRPIDATNFGAMVTAMVDRLDAEDGHIEMSFPYFVTKFAPVSGVPSTLDYEVTFVGRKVAGRIDTWVKVLVGATSLCPCSKAISEYGAHNQRSHITMNVKVDGGMWLEDLIEIAEQEASCELWGVLKREDEKYVTERAYENPKFVEDLVRDVAARLTADPRVRAYSVESENFESIHNHSAYARIDVDKDA